MKFKFTLAMLRALLLGGSALLAAPTAQAVIYYWDGNDDALGFGTASGTWATPTLGTTTAGWSTDATGATIVDANSVTTATTDTLNFGDGATGLAAGSIGVGTVSSGNITFASGSGDIVLSSGGTITMAAASTITVSNTKDTINSVLTGAATSLTKAGTGTLSLGALNTYSGATLLTAGTLQLGNAKAIGTGALTITGGSLDSSVANLVNTNNNLQNWNGSFAFVGTENLNLGTGIITLNANATVNVMANTLSVGKINDPNFNKTLTKTGNGTLRLTGINTGLTSGTNVNAGTLQIPAGAVFNASANGVLTVQTGGVLDLNNWVFSATTGSLGNMTRTATQLVLNNGTVRMSNTAATSGSRRGFTIGANGATLEAAGAGTWTLDASATSATITRTTGTLNLAGSGDAVLNMAIPGSGAVTKSGTGTWTFTDASTYTGTTTIQAGKLVAGGNSLSTSLVASAVTVATSDIITYANTFANGDPVIFNAATAPVGLASGLYYVRDVTGANFKVSATPGGGVVDITSTGSSVTVAQPRTLGNTSAIALGNGSTLASDAPALLINGAFTVDRNITIGSVANAAAFNATIGGTNTTGTATYTGSITLNNTATNYTSTLQAATGGTVEFMTGTWTTNNKAIAIGTAGNTGTVKISNAIATTGGINLNFGSLVLNAAFTGGTLTVAASSGALITSTGTGTVGGTLALGAATTLGGAGDLNINGAVTGGFNLTKVGAGVTTFGAAGTLTGVNDLTAQGGTTNVNSVIGTGVSNTTVSDVVVSGIGTKLRFGSVSQTLSSLTIGTGSTVIFTSGAASGAFSGSDGKGAGLGRMSTVPEPGTIGLLLVGTLGVLGRRRHQA